MQQSPEAGFSSYDRLYDFELQLFVQTFCNDVVREASREMQSDDVVATAQQGRDGEPPSPANCTVAGSRKDGGPGDVRFLDSALSDELSSGTPTPLASTTKRKSPLAVAAARRTLNRRSPTSADAVNVNQGQGAAPEPSNIPRDVLSQSLLELSTIANAIVEYEPDAAHERRRTLVDRYWPLQGPFFLNPMEAKAFLQQSMTLGQREVFARQQMEDDIRRWWREFHRIAAPWHARAHEEHDEYNRLLFREINMRRDLEEQEDVARAVVRYLESSDVHGAEYTRRVFMLAESVSREELRQRQHLLSREIKVRAQYIAGRRMAFTLPPHRRATLIDYLEQLSSQLVNESSMDMTQAFSSMNSQSSADQHRLLRPSTAADGVTAFERLFPQNRTSTLFETESVRTSLRDVSAATRREARESLLSEQSHKRAEQIRASSASLQERLAVTRAKDAVTRRLTVAQERQEMQARRTMQAALREDSFAKLQQEVKIERLAYEWQSYEGKHPEVKDTFKSLLVGSDRYRDTMQGRTTTMSAATNDSQRRHSGEVDSSMFAPRVSRRCSSATPSPGVSTLSFLPKHQLPPAQKKLLHERTVLRTAAFDMKYHPHRARASVFLGKQQSSNTRQRPASAATVMLHDVSSIAHNTTLDESALEGGGGGLGTEGRTRTPSAFGQQLPHHYRSHTPPLQSEEAKLVESCEVLFSTMKSTSYHYVAPPPMLYSDDGSDATTGRNLFGDDVELHLLSPLERVLRWNLRAQQALRNEEFSIAEMHLKNAMSTLHTAEKDRRRAARRRSKQSSRHNAGADSAEEETLSEQLSAQPSLNVSGGVSWEDGDREAGLLTQSKSGTHHHTSPATSLDSGFGFLSLQNVKMLTYTNRSFLYRAMGRYRDALQDLQAVLKVQQTQQSDIDTYVATLAPPAAIGRSGAAGRRSVLVVSPRSGEDTAMAKHMYENGLGITPDVLLGVSALLLQVDRRDESLHFARAAVDMLTKQAREDLQRLLAVASQDPSDRKLHGGGQTPSGAVPRSRSPESPRLGPSSSTSTQLQYRNLFINSVTALHNIAMTQSAMVVNGPEDAEERRVGKSSHAAALRLGRTVLGADHGVVVRVEAHARTIAQLLAQ